MTGCAAPSRVLIVAAIAEGLTGLALVFAPGPVVRLLLGSELPAGAVPVARVAGIAIAALAVACWPGPPRLGMVVYVAAVALYLPALGAAGAANGLLLWPAVAAHAAVTLALWRVGE